MDPVSARDGTGSVEVHALVARQRVRHGIFAGVVVCVALFDAGLVALAAAGLAGYTGAGIAVLTVVLVAVAATSVSAAAARHPGEDAPDSAAEREQAEAIAGRLAARLGMRQAPRIRIVDDPGANAFVTDHGRKHTVTYTSGLSALLRDEDGVLDRARLEAVIAHELAAVASRGTGVTRLSFVVLRWALAVVAPATGIALVTDWVGRRHLRPIDIPPSPATPEQNLGLIVRTALRLSLFLCLLLGRLVLLFGVVVARIAGGTRNRLIGQRVLASDAIALQLTLESPALEHLLDRLRSASTAPAQRGALVRELCFADPDPGRPRGWAYVPTPYPSLDERIAHLRTYANGSRTASFAVAPPLVAGVVLLALLGGMGMLALQLPLAPAPGRPQATDPKPLAGSGSGTTAPDRTGQQPATGPAEPVPTASNGPGKPASSVPRTPAAGAPDTASPSPAGPTRTSAPTRHAPPSTPPAVPRPPVPPPPAPPPPPVPPPPVPPPPPAPEPAPVPAPVEPLTRERWNHFCTQRSGVPAEFGADAYQVGCRGVPGAFASVTEVCDFEFPATKPNVDRLGDFHNPLSWGCITRARSLGAFRLSEAFLEQQTGRAVTYVDGTNPSAYGYRYADGSPLALDQVCARRYGTPAVDRILDVHNAHTDVQCYPAPAR
ncbi:M48 family metalloprotease [Streptomyces sp. NPDC021093]|uniref:M48 family metalloprotease n=1 Tax=Streptomyces sp. NPDC021093 TaxID=3365112 RepID=UPI0037B9C465